jgi:hypothetical protein
VIDTRRTLPLTGSDQVKGDGHFSRTLPAGLPRKRRRSGTRPLKGGAPRLLDNHGGATGKSYRRCFDALVAEYGPLSDLGRLEAGRVAAAWVELEAAGRALTAARRARITGKGRRPSESLIMRFSKRRGLADSTYSQALDKLKELTAATRKRQPTSGRELLERVRAGGGA